MDLRRIAAKVAAGKVVAPEAPEGAPLGKWAWAPHREGVPDEPDTELEEILYADLKAHFSNQRVGLPLTTVALLQAFMTLGWYTPVLHAPPLKTLYRGLKLRGAKQTAEFLGIPPEELEENGTLDLSPSRTFSNPNGFSTSWSARKYITQDFSERGERGWALTLSARVEENANRFLAGPGGLYDVVGLSMYHLEKETIGLEPILVHRVEWARL